MKGKFYLQGVFGGLFFAMSSCVTTKKACIVCDTYSSSSSIGAASEKMVVKKNGAFIYEWQKGLYFGTAEGVWIIVNDSTFVFTSMIPEKIKDSNFTNIRIPPRPDVDFKNDTLVLRNNCLFFADSSYVCAND